MPGKDLKSAENASKTPSFPEIHVLVDPGSIYLSIYLSIYICVFPAGIPQRPLPAQVTGGAASKKPQNAWERPPKPLVSRKMRDKRPPEMLRGAQRGRLL